MHELNKSITFAPSNKNNNSKTFRTMKAMTTKLSCEILAQVIGIKKVKDEWCVEQRDTKNLLDVEHNIFAWRYTDYGEALSQYISVVEQQARHIALMSL